MTVKNILTQKMKQTVSSTTSTVSYTHNINIFVTETDTHTDSSFALHH